MPNVILFSGTELNLDEAGALLEEARQLIDLFGTTGTDSWDNCRYAEEWLEKYYGRKKVQIKPDFEE